MTSNERTRQIGLLAGVSVVALVLFVAFLYGGRGAANDPFHSVRVQDSSNNDVEELNDTTPSPTRISHALVPVGSTIDPARAITPDPNEPTPHWLYDDDNAVQYAKSVTQTDDWNSYVVKRTTIEQWAHLKTYWWHEFRTPAPPIPIPTPDPIDQDNSEAVWVVAFDTDELLTVGQIIGFVMLMPDSDPSETRGRKAYLVFDEAGNPYEANFLEEEDQGGSASSTGPTFAQIEALPSVPGTLSTSTP